VVACLRSFGVPKHGEGGIAKTEPIRSSTTPNGSLHAATQVTYQPVPISVDGQEPFTEYLSREEVLRTIHVERLVKTYKFPAKRKGLLKRARSVVGPDAVKEVVKSISFDVLAGELVGFIGPNGAGKSTTIKMLTGILVPTSGTVEINGLIPHKNRKANAFQIGAVFGQRTALWWDIPVIDSLHLLRDIYRIPQTEFDRRMNLFSDLLGLHQFQDTPVRKLSLGQRVRADFCAALIHSPQVLFLDEPTIGVDIVAKDRIRQFLRDVNRELNVTVLLTTHDMGDIEKLCDRVMIIDDGTIIYDGSVDEIKTRYGTMRTLVIDFEHEIDEDMHIPRATLVKSNGRRFWYRFNRFENTPADIITHLGTHHPIVDLTVEEPQIEDMVRTIYEMSDNRRETS